LSDAKIYSEIKPGERYSLLRPLLLNQKISIDTDLSNIYIFIFKFQNLFISMMDLLIQNHIHGTTKYHILV